MCINVFILLASLYVLLVVQKHLGGLTPCCPGFMLYGYNYYQYKRHANLQHVLIWIGVIFQSISNQHQLFLRIHDKLNFGDDEDCVFANWCDRISISSNVIVSHCNNNDDDL